MLGVRRRESVLARRQQFRVALRCEVLRRKRLARPLLDLVSRQVDAQHRQAVFGEGRELVADLLVERVRSGIALAEPADDLVHDAEHDEDEDAAAEQDARDDEVGRAEQRDCQVAYEEADEQDERYGKNRAAHFETADLAHALHEAVAAHDVVCHQDTARIDHGVDERVHVFPRRSSNSPVHCYFTEIFNMIAGASCR